MVRKLILHAGDPGHAPPDAAQLARALQDLGLVDGPVPGQVHAWYAGDRFLSLVIFLGCSPRVVFQPVTDEQAEAGGYCHIRYRMEGDDPVFRAAPGPLRPRCPACRKPVAPDPSLLREGADGTARQQCPSCGQTHGAMELDWRHGAGCGRWFLEIWSVHPHEAVPADDLITALERTAATAVRYFYE